MKKLNSNSGITLIALTITIVLLLILSSVIIVNTIGGLQSNIENARKNKLLSELEIVQHAVLQQYTTFLSTKNKDLLVGTKANADAATLANHMRITLIEIPAETENADYYLLNKTDLKKIGIGKAEDEDEYIVNYYTGEVMNKKTNFTNDNIALYLIGRNIEMTIEELYNQGKIKIGDYVAYTLDGEAAYTVDEIYSGHDEDQTITRNSTTNNLNWRVLEIKHGQVTLISDTPTTSTIYLTGANGYNNAVKILDDLCSALYGSSIGTARSLKIEDIEDKLTYDYTQYKNSWSGNTEGIKYGESVTHTTNRYYPAIFAQETTGKVDGIVGTKYGISTEQTEYITGSTQAGTSITTTQTNWDKLLVASDFKGDSTNDNIYYELFVEGARDLDSWLASRSVTDWGDGDVSFSLRWMWKGRIRPEYVYNSDDSCYYWSNMGVRPIVTLQPNVQLEKGYDVNGVAGWNIK